MLCHFITYANIANHVVRFDYGSFPEMNKTQMTGVQDTNDKIQMYKIQMYKI